MSPRKGEHPQKRKEKIQRLPRIHKGTDANYIYIYDKEWLKTVLLQRCPSCQEPLTKKGIKRECSKNTNHFLLYGNPIPSAYNRQLQGTTQIEYYGFCDECFQPTFRDYDRGEIVCSACGLLQDDELPDII
jgi:hypothetical protein